MRLGRALSLRTLAKDAKGYADFNYGPLAKGIGRAIGWKSKSQRNADNAAEAAVNATSAATAKSAAELDAMYSAENLDADSQARVDAERNASQIALRRALAGIGASDGSGRNAGETAALIGADSLETNIREGWHAQAMRLHGMSEQAVAYFERMSEAERNSKMTNFSSLLESVGAISTFYTQMKSK